MSKTGQFVDSAAAILQLKSGKVVAFPTETFYGLGADPRNSAAVAELAELKGRADGAGIPLIIDSAARASEFAAKETAQIAAVRIRLQEHFWPGPLTLVIAVNERTKQKIARPVFGPRGTLALRVSPQKLARELAAGAGGAITATSANPKGAAPAASAAQAAQYFPHLAILDDRAGDAPAGIAPSTIVDVSVWPLKVIREGAISKAALEQAVPAAFVEVEMKHKLIPKS